MSRYVRLVHICSSRLVEENEYKQEERATTWLGDGLAKVVVVLSLFLRCGRSGVVAFLYVNWQDSCQCVLD